MSEVFDVAGSLLGADAHKSNAKALRKEAKEAASQGYRDEEAQRREGRQIMGLTAAMLAETGGTGGSGDLILKQNELMAELDALNIRYGGLQRRKQLRTAARGESAAATSSYLSAGGSLLLGFNPKSSTRTLLSI